MLPSHGYQGFRAAPIPSGWVQTGERWALWYNGRETANVTFDGGPGVRLWMEGRKMWQTKEARATNVRKYYSCVLATTLVVWIAMHTL